MENLTSDPFFCHKLATILIENVHHLITKFGIEPFGSQVEMS